MVYQHPPTSKTLLTIFNSLISFSEVEAKVSSEFTLVDALMEMEEHLKGEK